MTTCFVKSFSFGLVCVSFVNVCEFVCLFLFRLDFGVRMWNLVVLIADHCLSVYFTLNAVKA